MPSQDTTQDSPTCHDCNSTTLITTESRIVCHQCGLVATETIYDYGPILSDNQTYDTYEPLLENGKLVVDVVKRLKNWLGRDITLQLEMALTDEVERLANELLLYDPKCYPSQYYWAGAIVYSRRYQHVTRKQVVQYLYGGFDKGCERMHKLLGDIVQEKHINKKNSKTPLEKRVSFFKTKLIERSSNCYENYLKEYWLDKILQVDKIKNGKPQLTEDEILERSRIKHKKEYYKQKDKLLNGKFKEYGRPKIFDKWDKAGDYILDLHDSGLDPGEIKQRLFSDYIGEISCYEEYSDVAFCSVRTIRNYINEHYQ